MNNSYSNIKEVLVLSARNEIDTDSDDFKIIYAHEILNNYLAKGWILLGLDYERVADNAASLSNYIIGLPNSDSTQ